MNYLIAGVSVAVYSVLIYILIKSFSRRPALPLMTCVLFGILSALIALGLEFLWNRFLGDFISSHPSLIFFESFVGVSLLEEGAKWLWLVFVIYKWPTFKLYTDGILYTCAIAAGFNIVEGSIYAGIETEPFNMIIRSFTAVPVHFLFAIVMGFLFSRYKFENNSFFWFSLIIPVVLHGLYDFFILQQYHDLLIGAAILVLIGCLSLSIWICRTAVRADKLRVINIDVD